MKIPAFALVALSSSSVNADTLLRGATNKFFGATQSAAGSTAPGQVRLVIHGLEQDVSPQDLELIERTAIQGYNRAYQHVGYSLLSFEAQLSGSVSYHAGKHEWLCPSSDDPPHPHLCQQLEDEQPGQHQSQVILGTLKHNPTPAGVWLSDDDSDGSMATLADFAALHHQFETTFCASLRASGSNNLMNAHDCYFAFLDTLPAGQPSSILPSSAADSAVIAAADTVVGKESAIAVGSNTRDNTKRTMMVDAQIMFRGARFQDLTKEDQTILDQNLVTAYNGAYSKTGYGLASVESVNDMDVFVPYKPRKCRFCQPDDETEPPRDTVTLVAARAVPIGRISDCRHNCPPGVHGRATTVSTEAFLSDKDLLDLHATFETNLCTQLQESGSINFASLYDCSFRFVYNPVAAMIMSSAVELASQL